MSGEFYLNPTALVVENNSEIEIISGTSNPFKLSSAKHEEFLKNISYEKKYYFEELLTYFTIDETFILLKNNIFIDNFIKSEDRYSRNQYFLTLNNEDKSLEFLKDKKVLILGAGGVSTHIIWAYSAVGIKDITIVDFDIVEVSNLNRQLFYEENDIGKNKIDVIYKRLSTINKDTNLTLVNKQIKTEDDFQNIITSKDFDLVVVAIDDPPAVRNWINTVCVKNKIPYIGGGFGNSMGVIGITYIPNITPCLECMEDHDLTGRTIVSGTGGSIIAPIAQLVSSKMAIEGINVLLERKNTRYFGSYEIFNYKSNSSELLKQNLVPNCKVCSRKNITTINKDLSIVIILFIIVSTLTPILTNFIDSFLSPIFAMLFILTSITPIKKYVNIYEVSFLGITSFSLSYLIFLLNQFNLDLLAPNYVALFVMPIFWFIVAMSISIMFLLLYVYILNNIINHISKIRRK